MVSGVLFFHGIYHCLTLQMSITVGLFVCFTFVLALDFSEMILLFCCLCSVVCSCNFFFFFFWVAGLYGINQLLDCSVKESSQGIQFFKCMICAYLCLVSG